MTENSRATAANNKRGKFLVGLWIVATALGTTAWWAGLAWATVLLVEAMS